MNRMNLDELLDPLRDEAELLRRRGLLDLATFAESLIGDVRERMEAWWIEELSLQDAAEESGLAYSTLQQRVSEGSIPNAGEAGRPRIRRCDLPTKGRSGPQAMTEDGMVDLAAEVLSRRAS